MDQAEREIAVRLLQAIDNDWAISDDSDEDQCMVLVNDDRDEHKELKPKKSLVAKLEAEGLIQLDKEKSDPKGSQREFMDFFGERVPVPFVYFYVVSRNGREFLAKHTSGN